MRVLLDENLPLRLAPRLPGHSVDTVRRRGWTGLKNGDLLDRIRGRYEVFVTMDRRFGSRHPTPPCGIVLIRAMSNRIGDLVPLIPEILRAIEIVRPGEFAVVPAPR